MRVLKELLVLPDLKDNRVPVGSQVQLDLWVRKAFKAPRDQQGSVVTPVVQARPVRLEHQEVLEYRARMDCQVHRDSQV